MKMPYGSMFQFYDMDGNVFLLREEARVHYTSAYCSGPSLKTDTGAGP